MSMARIGGITLLLLAGSSVLAATIKDEQRLTASDGKTLAVVVACNACQSPKAKPEASCLSGATDGFWDGEKCGVCLMKANYGARIGYPYDVHLTGHLKDAEGKPLPEQFVVLTLPNAWTVTSRTDAAGQFRLMLGATIQPRRANTPLTKDLGTFTYKKASGREDAFALYMLPEQFKSCAQ